LIAQRDIAEPQLIWCFAGEVTEKIVMQPVARFCRSCPRFYGRSGFRRTSAKSNAPVISRAFRSQPVPSAPSGEVRRGQTIRQFRGRGMHGRRRPRVYLGASKRPASRWSPAR
jgi:hypothetical protein